MARIPSIPIGVTQGLSTAGAAKAVGVSKRTLLQWIYAGLLREPKRIRVAGVIWRIWNKGDIERARKVKATMRPGPKTRAR